MSPKWRILIVDDHGILRAGVRALLAGEPDMQVVGEASTGKQALESIEAAAPDVVLMDIRMQDLNGIDATRQAIAGRPDLKVIGLSAEGSDKVAAEFLRAGGMGFVKKDAAYEELVAAIRAVVNNRIYCDSGVIAQMARGNKDQGASAFETLTAREREHLQLIAEGRTTKEIASQLEVSIKTAETHRRNLMIKLGLHSVADLTKYAVREGLTSP
jgi:DNA-binding NarL/FixJ family response regulator